jgi:hypothetical protein
MAHLISAVFDSDSNVMFSSMGMWLFLSVGAVSLFVVFIPLITWMENRRKEREAFYKADTLRRIAEASTESAKTAVALLREEERIKARKVREGMKIGGVINIGVGIGLMIFLRALLGPHGADGGTTGPVFLCGLIPGLIGVAMLVYVYVLAAPVE